MGLLDDAIREHLELKRRRGSDPAEITRQEQEALGPPRRTPESDAADQADEDLPVAREADQRTKSARPEPEPEEGADFFVDDPDDPFLPDEPPAGRAAEPPPPLPSSPPPAPAAEDPWDDETAAMVDAPPPSPRRSAAQRLAELDEAEARRAATPPPAASPPPPPPAAPLDDEPFADVGPPDADDIVPADEEHDGEDLLEETPDFLEETPDHDRLWFEQRPPRDFDFDG